MSSENNLGQVDSLELWEQVTQIEKSWEKQLRQSLPKTDSEWLQIFPEAKKIIPEKIKEWESVAKSLRPQIKQALQKIEDQSAKENHWFWRAVLKYTFPPVKELATARQNIKRLKWMTASKRKNLKWESALQRAREQDIVSIAERYGLKLRKIGKTYRALCPIHTEETASFYIYPPSRFVCFGCGIKGDTIAFVQIMDRCEFKEAVYKIQNL